jgi:hypothetical protein
MGATCRPWTVLSTSDAFVLLRQAAYPYKIG